jgi:ferredoxin/flavodoxin---NADP+ reductase
VNAVLDSRVDLHETLCILRVRPDGGSVPQFEPGQFTNLGLFDASETPQTAPGPPSELRRAFSFASPPAQRDSAEFYIQRVDDGHFTQHLWKLQPGGRLWLDERVYGNFTLADVPPTSELVLVATGTGLGPYLSMLRQHRGGERWKRCALVHSARHQADLGYRGELEALARRDPTFRYLPTLTREPASSSWSGLRSHVQEIVEPAGFERLAGWPLDPATAHVFLCGNPQMIIDLGGQLAESGFRPHRRRAPGQVHSERYW